MSNLSTNKVILQKKIVKKRQEIFQRNQGRKNNEFFTINFDLERASNTNCENLLGSIEVPVGVVGPVRLNSSLFSGSIFIPLATSEGALVASVSRGCKTINLSDGLNVFVKKVGMTRAPVFQCRNIKESLEFISWIDNNFKAIKKICESTSKHLKLLRYKSWNRANFVFTRFVFDTDEAMGMNMVTIALNKVWLDLISKKTSAKLISISSNFCCDKKESVINRLFGRGYHVKADLFVSEKVVNKVLKTTSEAFYKTYFAKNVVGSNLAGSLSSNMHAANMIAAVYLATGQDMAHVVEGAQCTTVVEKKKNGFYIAVDLPNINVGVVGGGTWLPAQSQARSIVRGGKSLNSKQLAAVVGTAVMAGEISGIAALSSNSLADSHSKLARTK